MLRGKKIRLIQMLLNVLSKIFIYFIDPSFFVHSNHGPVFTLLIGMITLHCWLPNLENLFHREAVEYNDHSD